MKQHWSTIAGLTALSFPIVIKLFLKQPHLVTALSIIPVMQYMEKHWKITPLLSKVLGILLFSGFMILSWICAEIVVFFCAIAFAQEAIHWASVIRTNWKKHYTKPQPVQVA